METTTEMEAEETEITTAGRKRNKMATKDMAITNNKAKITTIITIKKCTKNIMRIKENNKEAKP